MDIIKRKLASVRWLQISMFFILGTTAACGLMYEYMLSSYSARVLGSTEKVIFTVILLMILAMGAGAAWIPRFIKNKFNGFAIIESLIVIAGGLSVVLVSVSHGIGYVLPEVAANTFKIPTGELGGYGLLNIFSTIIESTPYVIAVIIGLFVGAEIPLMTEIRQNVTTEKLENNMGTMYGVDYAGAFIGGMLYIYILHTLQVSFTAVIVASTNLLIGLLFVAIFRKHITAWKSIVSLNVISVATVFFVYSYGWDVERWAEQLLYQDKIIYTSNTDYQKYTVTARDFEGEPTEFRTYINGNTQFSSADEGIYHSMLVTPAMLAAKSHRRVLVIGGGDGLAVRNILKWNPESVTVLDLDHEFIGFFTNPVVQDGKIVNKALLELNEYAFRDPRVSFKFGDAYLSADELIRNDQRFDVVIIDLPDPNHPALAKLYSTVFYSKIKHLMTDGASVVVQSTSPTNAQETFMCVKKTMEAGIFENIEQYHVNVPSFGEWGFTIGIKGGESVKSVISHISEQYPDDGFSTKSLILGSFEFGKNFYADYDNIKVNYVDSVAIYEYHQKNWHKMTGTFRTDKNDNG